MRKHPDLINAYLQFTDHSEPCRAYRIWSILGAIGGAMRRRCWLTWDNVFYPNQYIVLIGPSGTRKSTAMRPAKSMLIDIGITIASQRVTNEGFIDELAESESGVTINNHGQPVSSCSLTVLANELAVFIGHQNNRFIEDLTDLWDCEPVWRDRTRGKGKREIQGPWVNIIGGITPDLLNVNLPKEAFGTGFTARCIFVYAHSKAKTVVDPFNTQEDLRLREEIIHDLRQISQISGQYQVKADFIDLWSHWYANCGKHPFFDSRFLSSYADRRQTHVLKLSMIIAASRTDERIITGADLQRAINILEETEVQMPNAFRNMGKLEYANIIVQILDTLRMHKHVAVSELQNKFMTDVDPFQLNAIIQSLQNSGQVECEMADLGRSRILHYKGESSNGNIS